MLLAGQRLELDQSPLPDQFLAVFVRNQGDLEADGLGQRRDSGKVGIAAIFHAGQGFRGDMRHVRQAVLREAPRLGGSNQGAQNRGKVAVTANHGVDLSVNYFIRIELKLLKID